MDYSAQRVRAKARAAVKRREDLIEQDELESGELNLIPYLDMVTNLMLFLLASVSAGLILVQINTTLPDRKAATAPTTPSPATSPDDQPLKLFVSIARDRVVLWSLTGLEGTLHQPKVVLLRTGREGEACDGAYMCESNDCDAKTEKCIASHEEAAPVFDYRALNNALFEIASRRYAGRPRKIETYPAVLQADGDIPYSTIVSVMAAMRCKLPEFGKEVTPCALPTEDAALKKAPDPMSPDGKLYDTTRANYDPRKMALFPDIQFSTGFEG
ncbi:MAG TPA: biopolymer transporter ExbD [Kofleriaceae bacterium]|jgi:biopolymer transport protein ExbD|nr:biopolymer transporter ExbD [Kofleriaceae bacterium]